MVLVAPVLAPVAIVTSTVSTIGCKSVWQPTVTLTETVDSASKEYAKLFNQGLINSNVDKEVTKAHAAYQKSAGVAAAALRAYKLSGNMADYDKAFGEAMTAANEFVNLIVPFLTNSKATEIKTNLSKSTKL